MAAAQISSEAALPGYVWQVAHRTLVLSGNGKVSSEVLPSILSNHTAVRLMRPEGSVSLCVRRVDVWNRTDNTGQSDYPCI